MLWLVHGEVEWRLVHHNGGPVHWRGGGGLREGSHVGAGARVAHSEGHGLGGQRGLRGVGDDCVLTSGKVEVSSEVVDVNVLRLWRTGAGQWDARHVGRQRDVRGRAQAGVQAHSALQTVEHCRGAPEVQLDVLLSLGSLPRPLGRPGQWSLYRGN